MHFRHLARTALGFRSRLRTAYVVQTASLSVQSRVLAKSDPRFTVPVSVAEELPDLKGFDEELDSEEISANTLKAMIKAAEPGSAELQELVEMLKHVEAGKEFDFEPEFSEEPGEMHDPLPSEMAMLKMGDDYGWNPECGIPRHLFQNLIKRVLIVKRVVNMTSKGKISSIYSLVVVGNGKGVAGYGEGKSVDAAGAVQKATMRAIKNMVWVPRYDARTVYHDIQQKFKATYIRFGNRVNPNIHEICRCLGIHDLSAKVRGSRNPMNVVKGAFLALQSQRLPEDLATMRGKRMVDVQAMYYGRVD